MTNARIIVLINPDLQELIPNYLKSLQTDLNTMLQALAANDFSTIREISHQTKGHAGGYGFAPLGEIGDKLEVAAQVNDKGKIKQLLADYKSYLNNVEIVYE